MAQTSASPQTDMIQTTPTREYRDRLFKAIFGRDTEQSKRWRLDIYNALNGTSYTDPDALEVNTTYIEKKDIKILKSRLVKIPEPHFVVFYNGSTKKPDTFKMRLSDAFERCGNGSIPADITRDFEWTATVININPERNKTFQKNCKALYDYVRYVGRIADNKKKGLPIKEAVDDAVNWAIEQEFLDGFFRVNKAEVRAMCLTEYDEEATMRAFRREGYEDGYTDGEQKKAEEAAQKLIELNTMSVEQIAYVTELPIEHIRELQQQVTANA